MNTYPDNDAVTTLVAAALFAPSPTDPDADKLVDGRGGAGDLAEKVRTEPLRSGDANDVGFNAVGMAGIAVTYDEEWRAPFYEAIAQGQHGDGTLFELFAQEFVDDFELGPNFAVDCIDVPHPTTTAEVEALATQAADDATVLPELSGADVRVFAFPACTGPCRPQPSSNRSPPLGLRRSWSSATPATR